MLNVPIYCFTSDVDWASEDCIADLMNIFKDFGVKPTFFNTHESELIRNYGEENPNEVGIHPNFFENSTHGKKYNEVIDHILSINPNAKSYRSHGFFDNHTIQVEMSKKGIRYDSNLCLYLQDNINPLRLGVANSTRFPVFWEDDDQWMQVNYSWDFLKHVKVFSAPGLKIINVHPFNIAMNSDSEKFYKKHQDLITKINSNDIKKYRNNKKGSRTFLIELLEYLKSKDEKIYTLDELFNQFPNNLELIERNESKGRHTLHTNEEYEKYWNMSDNGKQNFLKESYNKRDGKDWYATSRDYHVRDLEIKSILSGIKDKGKIIDIGCGNGVTLLTLANILEN